VRTESARRWSIGISVFLFAAAALVGLSGAASAFGAPLPAWALVPGHLMLQAFSFAWAFIPVYLGCAALILALPGFRRDAALGLSLSVLPFLTMLILIRYLDDPAGAAARLPLIAGMPRALVSMVLIITTLLECVVIAGLARTLFPEGLPGRPGSGEVPPKGEVVPPTPMGGEAPVRGRLLLTERPAEARLIDSASVGSRDHVEELGDKGAGEPSGPGSGTAAASQGFSFRVPEVPDLPPLRSLRRAAGEGGRIQAEQGEEASCRTEEREAAEEAEEGHLEEALQEIDIMEAAARGSVRRHGQALGGGSPGSPPAPDIEGIAFESVPPQTKPSRPLVEEGPAVRRPRKAKPYEVPIEGILNQYPDGQYWIIDDQTRRQAQILKETLEEFRVQAEVTGIRKGPVITMFEILPAPGVKLSKIVGLQDNIALRLAAQSVRIVAPIPGKHAVGIEVPNAHRAIVSFREMIENDAFNQKKREIPVVLGKDIQGEVQVIDLTSNPHILIAGATGAGKSVCVNAIILSILYKRRPDEVKMIMIDPKIVELKLYNDIPHLLTPVITEPKRAFQALQYCICEMERRYSLLDGMGVRDIRSYNKRIKERDIATEPLPYIVVIIDEFADLMATTGKELESTLARLAAMSRAVGIHLVLATQRPSIDVITGLIKANIPSRIAFMVASKTDSRIIIDMIGAEKLLGRGDMLYASASEPFPVRIQGAFVSEEEVERAVEHVKTLGEPEYIDEEIFIEDEESDEGPSLFGEGADDPMMDKALEIVLQAGKASASYIQRRLKIGYNRAARLVEMMEERGIVGPQQGSKPRDLIHVPDRPRPARADTLDPLDGEEDDA